VRICDHACRGAASSQEAPYHRRAQAVFSPLRQLANIPSMAAAGILASTVLRGMHVVVGG
jgi:hypothetical protein